MGYKFKLLPLLYALGFWSNYIGKNQVITFKTQTNAVNAFVNNM